MIRGLVVNALYDVANAICIAADKLSPADDSVWRARRWGQVYAEKLRQAYDTDPAEPKTLGDLGDSNGEVFGHICCRHCEPDAHAPHTGGC